MTNVVLHIPKDRCNEVEIKGTPFIQVDIGLTADELILFLLKWESDGGPLAVVKNGVVTNETDD